ncbi:hypothetical protein ACE6H2_006722 [Prunus campanulata]
MEELILASPMRAKKSRSQARSSQLHGSISSQPQLVASRRPQREIEPTINGQDASCSIVEWGTGTKLHIDFDTKWKWKPIKENAQKFSTQLGVIARNARKVPLTKFHGVDNTDVPDAYRPHCLKVVGNKWRDWKCRLKKEWYDKYETNEECLAITPPQVHTDQWKILVKYWGLLDVKECSEANKANRALGNAPHRTGHTSFAQVKNKYLEEREEHEQDEDYRDEVFTKVMGPDGHGCIHMYGTCITPSQVFLSLALRSHQTENRAVHCGGK